MSFARINSPVATVDSLMWQPTAEELATAMAISKVKHAASRPTQQPHTAKDQHTRAMRDGALSSMASHSSHREERYHTRSQARKERELSLEASMHTGNPKIVTAKPSRAPTVVTMPPKAHRPPTSIVQKRHQLVSKDLARRIYPANCIKFVFDPSKYPGASASRALVIPDDGYDMSQSDGAFGVRNGPQNHLDRFRASSMQPHILTLARTAYSHPPPSLGLRLLPSSMPLAHLNAARPPVEQVQTSTGLPYDYFPSAKPRELPTQDMVHNTADCRGSRSDIPIEIDMADRNDLSQPDKEWSYSGPIVPSFRSMITASALAQPVTEKQQAAARKAITADGVNKPHTKKQKKRQESLMQSKEGLMQQKYNEKNKQEKLKQEKLNQKREKKARKQKQKQRSQLQGPHTAPGSWTATIRTEVSQVSQSLFTRARNEMHVGRRSYPVVIEALERVIADLKTEAALYQQSSFALPVKPAKKVAKVPSAPPVPAASSTQPEVSKRSKHNFWKLPVKFVSAGMSALSLHIENAETGDQESNF